tara:strand:+ start:100 stop:591 length:492 start_codon:yes stop_codon:yes gene_type:complete
MVGLPASGKSYRVNEMVAMNPDAYVYSTDNIVEDKARAVGKTYTEVFESVIKKAKKQADEWLAEAIASGQDIIWDQTNLTKTKRRSIVYRLKKAGYEVVCECIPQPTSAKDVVEWNRRLQSRPGKVIPGFIIKNMTETYSLPTLDEGFDSVLYYDIHGAEQTI